MKESAEQNATIMENEGECKANNVNVKILAKFETCQIMHTQNHTVKACGPDLQYAKS